LTYDVIFSPGHQCWEYSAAKQNFLSYTFIFRAQFYFVFPVWKWQATVTPTIISNHILFYTRLWLHLHLPITSWATLPNTMLCHHTAE
jgi:hypothetical protein